MVKALKFLRVWIKVCAYGIAGIVALAAVVCLMVELGLGLEGAKIGVVLLAVSLFITWVITS